MIRYMTKNKLLTVFVILLMIASGVGGTLFSLVMSALIDCVSGQQDKLLSTLLYSVLFVFVYILLQSGYYYIKAYIIAETRKGLKNDLFEHIYFQNMADFETQSSAEYINELSNNIGIIEDTYFRNMIRTGEMLVAFLSSSLITIMVQPVMLIVMLVLALITLVTTRITTSPLERSMRVYSGKLGEYTEEIKDDFSGFGIIHLFHTMDAIIIKHRTKNTEVEAAKRGSENYRIICACVGEFVGLLSTVLVMGAAAYFSQKGLFSAGMVIGFGHLIGKVVAPITSIPTVIANFYAAKPIKERFDKILEKQTVKDISGEVLSKGDITLDGITYGYGEKKVLRDCTYCFREGGHYVLLGSSGAGKSSLLSLLSGIYQNYTGKIAIKGVDIKNIGRRNMSNAITMVKQDTFLFNDTIRNNITLFCDDYSEQQILDVIEQTGLKKMVAALPEGLETMIHENGSNFSGGEKQRIGLARALLRNSQILLLDEFTANLDLAIADELEDNILKRKDKTIITVTHQQTKEKLEKYDRVIVLKDGKLAEIV